MPDTAAVFLDGGYLDKVKYYEFGNRPFDRAPHVLRHTFLRKVTNKHGVEFAMEAAGHASSKYIWRYVKPSDAEKEKALDTLF